MQPQNQQVVQGMAAVYLSLHEEEKHLVFMKRLRDLQEVNKELNPQNNSYPLWDSSVKYSTGDVVEYSGSFYKAITVSTGIAPNSSKSDWVRIEE